MQGRNTWSTLINRFGSNCEISRGAVKSTVKMARQASSEQSLVNEASQSAVRFVVEHVKLQTAGFPVPPKKLDRIKSLGKFYTVSDVEIQEESNEIIGYRCRCTGGG